MSSGRGSPPLAWSSCRHTYGRLEWVTGPLSCVLPCTPDAISHIQPQDWNGVRGRGAKEREGRKQWKQWKSTRRPPWIWNVKVKLTASMLWNQHLKQAGMKLENRNISKLLQTGNNQIKKEKVKLELNTWARKLKKKNQEELSDDCLKAAPETITSTCFPKQWWNVRVYWTTFSFDSFKWPHPISTVISI